MSSYFCPSPIFALETDDIYNSFQQATLSVKRKQ